MIRCPCDRFVKLQPSKIAVNPAARAGFAAKQGAASLTKVLTSYEVLHSTHTLSNYTRTVQGTYRPA